ncbi:hypothetical protein CCYA_CCYA09G2726 [Cyanidiococcus yangmingshanensis]|nr:hypothetical protein CCYA_CCYA09G2726 [Cyanidiococcus yangmingshanensis]
MTFVWNGYFGSARCEPLRVVGRGTLQAAYRRTTRRRRSNVVCQQQQSDDQTDRRQASPENSASSEEEPASNEAEPSPWAKDARHQWPEYERGYSSPTPGDSGFDDYSMSMSGGGVGSGVATSSPASSREVYHDPVLVSRRELLYAVIGIAVVVTGIVGAVHRRTLRWFSLAGLLGSLRRRYPAPNVNLREFMMECEAGAGPVAPALQHCYYIQWLGGASSAVEAAPGHCAGKKLLVMLFWRATDPSTGVALDVLENLRPYLEFIDVVCMHTPKFDGEQLPRFVQLSAKFHEMNFPYGADASLHLWRDLGVTSWPTAVVLSPRSKRVLFAFEGHRSLPRILPCVRAAIDFYFPRRVAAQPPPEPTLRVDQLPTGQSFRLEARCDAFPLSAAALRELLESRRRALAAADAPVERSDQRSAPRESKRSHRKNERSRQETVVPPRSPLPAQDVYGRQILALLDTSRQALALRFPGKVDVHAESDRLFIADSGHHRILITKLSGEFIEQIGGRQGAGFLDGPFAEALFEYPQGLVFDPLGNRLVIADTGNDAIRIVSFTHRTVSTVSLAPLITEAEMHGVTGKEDQLQGHEPERRKAVAPSTQRAGKLAQVPVWAWERRWYEPRRTRPNSTMQRTEAKERNSSHNVHTDASNNAKQNGNGRTKNDRTGAAGNVPSGALPTATTGVRSRFRLPWDVGLHAGSVYIAVAGSHQIWRLDSSGILREFCGSGRPGLVDDSEASQAPVAFAAPHGLCVLGTRLYVVDSDSSTVRAIDLSAHWTRTILGGNVFFLENLSTYGDRDGWGRGGHLQFPCGCCALPDGYILLADTLNHKIKLLNLEAQDSRTLAGSGEAGLRDGIGSQAAFFAPQGIAYDPTVRMAFVADTYNHCIRQIDVATGAVRTLTLTPPAVLEALAEQQASGLSQPR